MTGGMTPGALQQSQLVAVDERLMDIGRRIQDGDELWRGDPNMQLCWNPANRMFEVVGLDAHGNYYVATSSPRCGPHLLVQLATGDWQRGGLSKQVAATNAASAKARADAEADVRREKFDRFHFELTKEIGHLEGGTRRLFGQVGR